MTEGVAMVTGSGQGIGRGIALALAETGAQSVVAERNPETVGGTAEGVLSLGRRGVPVLAGLRVARREVEPVRCRADSQLPSTAFSMTAMRRSSMRALRSTVTTSTRDRGGRLSRLLR